MARAHDWEPRRNSKRLRTAARDNHGYEYPVRLELGEYLGQPAWVLDIEGTPGSWFMATLLEHEPGEPIFHPTIWLDMGQEWAVANFEEIMREAVTLV